MDNYIGKEKNKKLIVEDKDTAKYYGSGGLDVLATPCLIKNLENISYEFTEEIIEKGKTTVGTKIDISHMAASPIGIEIEYKTKLIEVDRRRLVFEIIAYDEKEKIAEGIHERFIVDIDKFVNNAEGKLEK